MMSGTKIKKLFLLLMMCSVTGYLFLIHENEMSLWRKVLSRHQFVSEENTRKEGAGNLSILGEWLHAPEGALRPELNAESALNREKRLLILIWKRGPFLHSRHVGLFGTDESEPQFPSEGCSVKTCDLSYRDEDLARADVVIFHLHLTKGVSELPSAKGKPAQIWIALTDESPYHTFFYDPDRQNLSHYDGLFDWLMSYRYDSDVPVPYGRTIARKNFNDYERRRLLENRRKKLVAIMGSNCSPKNHRWEYVKKLKSLLGEQLEILGRCFGGNKTVCPGNYMNDCPILDTYKFYLSFENSNCREYITEKVFWNAYSKGSVPIIMGPPRSDCERLLPPKSFIYVADFASPNILVHHLRYLHKNDDAYDGYHAWRSHYIVINEHGFFGSLSKHYCRVCEALRYNIRPPNVTKYQRWSNVLNVTRDCVSSE